jgi:DNA-binding winged helix-turn-helix (wHTH) protein
MDITWSLDPIDQYTYYLKMARQIQKGLYQRVRAIILPYPRADAWYFPDLKLFESTEFKEKLPSINVTDFNCDDQTLINLVSSTHLEIPTEKEFQSDQVQFNKLIDDFLYKCELFFPDFKRIKKLKIIPTKFGTGSSYYRSKKDSDSVELTITYRIDKHYTFIFRSLLSSIVEIEAFFDHEDLLGWRVRKGIADFLTFNTTFRTVFPNEHNNPVLEFIDEYKGDIILESAKYYAQMGYPLTSCFSYKENTIFYNSDPVLGLSNKEIDIMKGLIDQKSQLITFDKLGEIYWGKNEDKFSLAALAKVIEKLRNSLEINGIPNSYIRTIRKQGYLLYD